MGDNRGVLSGPLTRKEFRGDNVNLLERALPYLRNGVTATDLAEHLGISVEMTQELLESLDVTAAETASAKPTEDAWSWLTESPELTRRSLETVSVGMLSSSTLDHPSSLISSLSTVTCDSIEAVASADIDYLFTVSLGERPNFHHAVLEVVVEDGLSWLPVRLIDGVVTLGPYTVPGETACYDCYFRRRVACDQRPEARLLEYEARSKADRWPPYHTAAWHLLGATTETELLSIISGYTSPATKNGIVTYDVRSGERERSRLYKVPGCESCARS